jgi:hypothetical protein
MERTSTYIKVWFWSRTDGSVPAEVKNGATSINTSNWVIVADASHPEQRLTRPSQGAPFAYFSNAQCDIASKFGPHQIVINLTFCELFHYSVEHTSPIVRAGGDWAGAVYSSQGCPGTCVGTSSCIASSVTNL